MDGHALQGERVKGPALPKLIGLLCALVALAACVIAKVDAGPAALRALIAFSVGSLLTQAWYAFIATRMVTSKRAEPADEEEFQGQENRAA